MYLSLSVRTTQDGGFCTGRWVFVCCIHRRDSRLRPLVFLGTTRRTRGLGCGYRCGYFLRAPTTGLVRIGWFRHCFQHHTLVPTKCMLAHYIFVMFLCYIRLRASGASWGNPGEGAEGQGLVTNEYGTGAHLPFGPNIRSILARKY